MTSVRGDGSELPGLSGTDDERVVETDAQSGEPAEPPEPIGQPATGAGAGSGGQPPAASGDEDPDGSGGGTPAHTTPWWKETLILVVTALILALVIKTFFVQAFYIPSGSMETTLNVNDRILVEKVSYWFGTPQRGDIVVFKDPDDWLGAEGGSTPSNPVTSALAFIGLYPAGGHLVKRVIGVGGDHVQCKDNSVWVNGVELHEQDYVTLAPTGCIGIWSVHVPAGHLWVLGDNRLNSADSRAHMNDPDHGFVPVSDVVGKVFVTVWPIDRWNFFERPAVFSNPALSQAAGLIQDTIPLGAFLVVSPLLYRRRGTLDQVRFLYDRDQDLQ